MKVLLLNPPSLNTVKEFADEKGDGYVEADDYGYFPPLGALYVLSSAEKKYPEHEYFFIDSVGEKLNYSKLEARIRAIQPDVVGITSFTISLVDVVLSAQLVKKINPKTHTCLGGHHPIAFPYEAAQLPDFDSIVVGEGEFAFAELINCIAQKKDFTKIVGVYTKASIEAFRENQFKDRRFLNSVIIPPAYVEDIDNIPPPNRKYIQHIDYSSIIGLTGKLATLISTRGCPYKCTFCDVPYKKYRERDLDLVMDEIEHCISLGYKEFHFYDDLFNINAKKLIAFCEALERRNLDHIAWDFRGRVNGVTYESLVKAKSVGLRMISFGVETGSDMGMKTLKKGSNIKQVENTFKWCKELGIHTVANYMIGLPHEKSIQDVKDNINFLIGLGPDYAQINILSIYPHTEIHRQAMEKGIAAEGAWEKFALDPSSDFKVEHWTEFMTEKELLKLQKDSYRRFYFRPKFILKSIKQTTSLHQLKSKAKGALKILNINVS